LNSKNIASLISGSGSSVDIIETGTTLYSFLLASYINFWLNGQLMLKPM